MKTAETRRCHGSRVLAAAGAGPGVSPLPCCQSLEKERRAPVAFSVPPTAASSTGRRGLGGRGGQDDSDSGGRIEEKINVWARWEGRWVKLLR